MPNPLFRGAFPSGIGDETSGLGKRPVIFDIVGPDLQTSLLPDNLKLVLHVNPSSMGIKYQKLVERMQTKGGFVEQHFGEGTQTISFEMATGGFMRLTTGLVYSTDPSQTGGSRRDSLAYDSYLDILSLFHNNGSVYDANGQIAVQGAIKVTFDGGVYTGWFTDFSVSESAEKPYMFTMSASFEVTQEIQTWRSLAAPSSGYLYRDGEPPAEFSELETPPTATPPGDRVGIDPDGTLTFQFSPTDFTGGE